MSKTVIKVIASCPGHCKQTPSRAFDQDSCWRV